MISWDLLAFFLIGSNRFIQDKSDKSQILRQCGRCSWANWAVNTIMQSVCWRRKLRSFYDILTIYIYIYWIRYSWSFRYSCSQGNLKWWMSIFKCKQLIFFFNEVRDISTILLNLRDSDSFNSIDIRWRIRLLDDMSVSEYVSRKSPFAESENEYTCLYYI